VRLGAIGDWQPAPGRVLRWRPTAAAAAAARSAPVNPGEPSFLQADHLAAYRSRREAGGTHRAWTGTVTELDGPLDTDALGRALTAFVRRHEGLRTWFDLDGPAPVRHLVPEEAVAFEVEEVPAPHDRAGEGAGGWAEVLTALFDAACRPDRWAPFVLGAVVRDGSASLFWGCDHAFTDGASQLMQPVEIETLYRRELGHDVPPLPEVTSFLEHTSAERARAAAYAPDAPEVRAWCDLVAGLDGSLPRFPLDLGLAPGETAPVRIARTDLLTGERADAFEAACRAAGGRLTSGIFAALAETERRLAGRDRYAGVTVLGTRDAGCAMTHGWLCNFAPVTFDLGEDLTTTLKAAEQAWGLTRAVNAMPVHVALGVMLTEGITTPERLGSPQMVSFLDLRRLPGADTAAYRHGLHFTGEGRTANCSLWVNRGHDDLYVVAQTPDTPTGQRSARRYLDTLAQVCAEIAA